jgi:hypothetical protein
VCCVGDGGRFLKLVDVMALTIVVDCRVVGFLNWEPDILIYIFSDLDR